MLSYRSFTRTCYLFFLAIFAVLEGAAQTIELRSAGLAVELEASSGAITRVTNLLTAEAHSVKGVPFLLETGTGDVPIGAAVSTVPTAEGVAFGYEMPGLRGVVRYRLPRQSDHLEKTIEVTNTGSSTIVLEDIVPWQLDFAPAFEQLHPHHDPSQFSWLINLFLRGAKGGYYCGVENSISKYVSKGTTPKSTWLQVHYAPRVALKPGETHVSDVAFLGSFRKEGIYLFKELGKLRRAVNQPDAIPSALNFDQEILDWGEVWAMQDYVRFRQPPHETERPGFYVRVVAMVGGKKTGDMGESAGFHIAFKPEHVAGSKQFTDDVASLGHIPHIEWATEWLGLGGYSTPTPGLVLENAAGLDVPVNPHWLEVVKYGWTKGIKTGIFETVTRDFARSKMEWKVRRKNGDLWTWDKDIPMNCWANREYVDWRLDVTDRAAKEHKLYMAAYDAIVPADWSWFGWPKLQTECFAAGHGHLPGDVSYPIFRNILYFLEELQQRNKKLALRVASGLTTAYPWALKNLIEYHPNFYDGETGATYWTSYNFRFLPMYKSGVLLSAKSKQEFEWLLLRSISVSDHFMLWPDAVPVALENKPFWTKWLTWADQNIDYLRVGRTLFREPWGDDIVASLPPALEGRLPHPDAMVHGSAHATGGHGFVFLFNPDSKARVASVPVNHWIGLTEGEQFKIDVLYPESRATYGPYRRGENLQIELPDRSAVVLELSAVSQSGAVRRPVVSATAPVDKAFLQWDEIPFQELHAVP